MTNILYENLNLERMVLKPYIKNKAGIYELVNLKNGKTYIGSSKNLYRRLNEYLNPLGIQKVLEKGDSHIIKALLKNGYSSFGIKILEFIDFESNMTLLEKKKLIFQREQYYINLVEPEYNIVRTIGDGEGREYPMKVRLQMRISNAASNKIYCYNKDGSFYKTFYSMLEAGSHLNINRRTISFRLKQSNPVHLKNKLETESYILSTFSLTQNDLDEFFASSEGLAIASSQKIRGHNRHIKVYAYALNGKPFENSPFESYAEAGKVFQCHPNTIRKYAESKGFYKGVKLSLEPL